MTYLHTKFRENLRTVSIFCVDLKWNDPFVYINFMCCLLHCWCFFLFVDNTTHYGSDCPILPKHLFAHDSPKDFWVGICMLISSLDSSCICTRLMSYSSGHVEVINAIISALSSTVEETGNSIIFWPALQCLSILLSRMLSRFWQYAFEDPASVLQTVLNNSHFKKEVVQWAYKTQPHSQLESNNSDNEEMISNSQMVYSSENAHPGFEDYAGHQNRDTQNKDVFSWIAPFLQSLLDFGDVSNKTIVLLFQSVHEFFGAVNLNDPTLKIYDSPLCKESFFTLSCMVELLFTKQAYTLMLNLKSYWLLGVRKTVDHVTRNYACSSLPNIVRSMSQMFHVVISILESDEKSIPETRSMIEFLTNFVKSINSLDSQPCVRPKAWLSADMICNQVEAILERLQEKRHSLAVPQLTFDVDLEPVAFPELDELDEERASSSYRCMYYGV